MKDPAFPPLTEMERSSLQENTKRGFDRLSPVSRAMMSELQVRDWLNRAPSQREERRVRWRAKLVRRDLDGAERDATGDGISHAYLDRAHADGAERNR